ncbi:unnamed protein product [Cylicocyclus nassatus]|uniref:Uncharacterized protein n=1 Tax=Cylicocyclus nassatus TaxID=53992 RepID=A0AA36HAA8_CYLNA|nr:unnamed protein product [Cylicocyclus nassatus]
MRQTDLNKLCLYLRNKIKLMYNAKNKNPPEMRVRRDKLEIKGVGEVIRSVILSMRLGINTEDWQGLPLEQLLDIRLRKQKEDGTLALGPLNLPGLEPEKPQEKEPEKETCMNEKENGKENENEGAGVSYSQAVRGKKRSTDEDGFVLPRKVKRTMQDKNVK